MFLRKARTLRSRLHPALRLLALLLLSYLFLLGGRVFGGRTAGTLRVTFLDVGQGDSAIIESPTGKVLIVDTGGLFADGSEDEGERVVAPYLHYRGRDHVDAIVLTHPHADHIGGATSLLREFSVGLLIDNGAPDHSPLTTQILTAAHERGVPTRAARRGEELDFGDGVTAKVLAPSPQETQAGVPNDASVTLRLEYGRTAFLLTGDAEAEEESEMLQSGQPLACDLLKVGHHGSHTSTTPAFLAAAHPRFAIVSVGAHNVYGHPSPEILARLRETGVRAFRTDKNGAVTCVSDGVTIRAEPMLP